MNVKIHAMMKEKDVKNSIPNKQQDINITSISQYLWLYAIQPPYRNVIIYNAIA